MEYTGILYWIDSGFVVDYKWIASGWKYWTWDLWSGFHGI